ncbi:unnamed protein product [Cladocopium goreaui]|uniref:Uncharacterized protein n=1 Tax=Cladocopium goreaui TaxID=2562237 RepID=A0A9P1FJW3_9DINO|nr:unnamed protein product [Cladocopium goreaui]
MPCPNTDPVAALDWLFSSLEKDLKESKMWPIRLMQHKHQDTLRNLLAKHSQLIEEKYFVLQQWKVQKDAGQSLDLAVLTGVIVDVASIRDAYLGDAAAAAGLSKPKGGKKRKSADDTSQDHRSKRPRLTPFISPHVLEATKEYDCRKPVTPTPLGELLLENYASGKNAMAREKQYPWLKGDYSFMLSSLQGDLKWVNHTYGSAVYTIPGAHPKRILHDMAHSQYLGTGKTLNGGALVVLCETGLWGNMQGPGKYDEKLQVALQEAHADFLAWKKQNKIACTQPRFTLARVNRRHRQMWPVLNSKAIAGKTISFFLTERAVAWANRPNATLLEKTLATCLWSYARMVSVMDSAKNIFTEAEAEQFQEHCFVHLQAYANLNVQGFKAKGKEPGRNCFVLLPKHHFLYHAGVDAKETRLNPKHFMLLSAESFVGYVGRIGRRTHRSSLTLRTIQKYLALMHLHVQRLERGEQS